MIKNSNKLILLILFFLIVSACSSNDSSGPELVEISSDEEDEEEIIDYEDTFNTEQLARIVKIAGLGNNIQLFVGDNLPMLFRTNVGGLGKISIYVKSKSLISADNRPPGITM